MSYATNAIDSYRIYFEDQGGAKPPVLIHGGFLDSVSTLGELDIVQAIAREFRTILVDHRGLGRSDRPHDPEAYAMELRVNDALAVLDECGIGRAHFAGLSWGGRLCFGIGEHAPDRVHSLVIGGNQPYAWPDSSISHLITQGLQAAREKGMEALVRAMEQYWEQTFPHSQRAQYLDNDPEALHAMWTKAQQEGAISNNLRAWNIPCFIFLGASDSDFIELARKAAKEIPQAKFMEVQKQNHLDAHMFQQETLSRAVIRFLRQ